MEENAAKQIFTENIDYLKTGPDSIWKGQNPQTGEAAFNFFGDLDTRINLHRLWIDSQTKPGIIVDLGGGDGRYKDMLQRYADRVVELDIDPSALLKIKRDNARDWEKELLNLVQANLVDVLPFGQASVGGGI